MTCDELHEHLDPFFDNEIGLTEAQKIQQHLEQCPTCEAIYAARLAVREALQKPEVRFTPPGDRFAVGNMLKPNQRTKTAAAPAKLGSSQLGISNAGKRHLR